ncbi:MAG: hypothetical protein WC781_03610 [Candidatus Pacearchaeota archaeon]|jgi:preprotein translocase subunit SecF
MESKFKHNLNDFFNKNYKILLLIPIIMLIASFVYMGMFFQQNGDIIKKDITLTGGTSIQVNSDTNIDNLKQALSKNFTDFSIREVSDITTGKQVAFIIETRASQEEMIPFLENYLGFKIDSSNSSIEFTGSSIGQDVYIQLILAIFFAFTFMGTVVFFIFSDKTKLKILLICISLLAPFLFIFVKVITLNQAFIITFIVLAIIMYCSIRYSIPGFAVILCGFTDLFMTLVVVNLLGIEVSTAGIVAFLMLIGYSVDTDILLTTRVLKRKGDSINHRIFGSFKTGITMTLTSISVVIIGLIITASFSDTLRQIFTILFIGLCFDIFNTWITNVLIIKWYAEKHQL